MDMFQEIGIPQEYVRKIEDDRFFAIVHKSWLKYKIKLGSIF